MRRQFSVAFKAQVVLEILKEERTVNEIAAADGVHPTQLTRWKGQVVDGLPSLFDSEKKAVVALEAAHEEELERLYAEIGRLTTQLEWLGYNYERPHQTLGYCTPAQVYFDAVPVQVASPATLVATHAILS